MQIPDHKFKALLDYLIVWQCPFDAELEGKPGESCIKGRQCKQHWLEVLEVSGYCEESEGIFCPRCHSEMVLRRSKFGEFYGCSKFPHCDGSRKV